MATVGSTQRKNELEAKRLHAQWQEALTTYRAGDDSSDWAQLFTAEQDTFDELIDFLEANNLNDSKFDPR